LKKGDRFAVDDVPYIFYFFILAMRSIGYEEPFFHDAKRRRKEENRLRWMDRIFFIYLPRRSFGDYIRAFFER
jgi:hypothetical protein